MERREHGPRPPPPIQEQSCWGLGGMWEVQQTALLGTGPFSHNRAVG